jgi:hypothetical protein
LLGEVREADVRRRGGYLTDVIRAGEESKDDHAAVLAAA